MAVSVEVRPLLSNSLLRPLPALGALALLIIAQRSPCRCTSAYASSYPIWSMRLPDQCRHRDFLEMHSLRVLVITMHKDAHNPCHQPHWACLRARIRQIDTFRPPGLDFRRACMDSDVMSKEPLFIDTSPVHRTRFIYLSHFRRLSTKEYATKLNS